MDSVTASTVIPSILEDPVLALDEYFTNTNDTLPWDFHPELFDSDNDLQTFQPTFIDDEESLVDLPCLNQTSDEYNESKNSDGENGVRQEAEETTFIENDKAYDIYEDIGISDISPSKSPCPGIIDWVDTTIGSTISVNGDTFEGYSQNHLQSSPQQHQDDNNAESHEIKEIGSSSSSYGHENHLENSHVTDGSDQRSGRSSENCQKGCSKPPKTAKITIEDLKEVFDLERPKAEKRLKLKRTTFSNLSRHFGISKWPYRTIRDVRNRQQANEDILRQGSISKEKRRKLLEQQQNLDEVIQLIYTDPTESRDSNTLAVLLKIVESRRKGTRFG